MYICWIILLWFFNLFVWLKKKDVKFKDLFGSCGFVFIKVGMVFKVFFLVDVVKCGKYCYYNLLRIDVIDL